MDSGQAMKYSLAYPLQGGGFLRCRPLRLTSGSPARWFVHDKRLARNLVPRKPHESKPVPQVLSLEVVAAITLQRQALSRPPKDSSKGRKLISGQSGGGTNRCFFYYHVHQYQIEKQVVRFFKRELCLDTLDFLKRPFFVLIGINSRTFLRECRERGMPEGQLVPPSVRYCSDGPVKFGLCRM